jgi:hypothetical protein
MQAYAGRGWFTDCCGGDPCEVVVDLEVISAGEWAGVLIGPVDWAGLSGDLCGLLLELPADAGPEFPRFSRVRIDVALGERAGANGVATVVEAREAAAVTRPRPRRRMHYADDIVGWTTTR